jgi:hypothetical protein
MPSRLNNPVDYSVQQSRPTAVIAREAVKAQVVGQSDNVSCGSFSDLELRPNEVRSSPDSGHAATASTCPRSAKKRHFKTQNNIEPFCRRTKVIPG